MTKQEILEQLEKLGIPRDTRAGSGRRFDEMDATYLQGRLDHAIDYGAMIDVQNNAPNALAERDKMAARKFNLSRVESSSFKPLSEKERIAAADALPAPEGFNSPGPARAGLGVFDANGRLVGRAK